jgi:hypothetical protein
MSARTLATKIEATTKKRVHERDNECCIFCGKPVVWIHACAHIVPRSAGGLGVEQNIITCCLTCHQLLDQTGHRKKMLQTAARHMKAHYGETWNPQDYIYKKG